MIDILVVSKLQTKYLKLHNFDKFTVINCDTFGSTILETNLFLISTYALSEFTDDIKKRYYDSLFDKITHGFLAWNCKTIDLPKQNLIIEPENPLTGKNNVLIYF